MAIKIANTTVIDNSRNITNVVDATISGDLTVNGGDITLGGTGRIQGIDTVSAPTDAASKAYVDANAGASLTGTNANVEYQLVFTDTSGLLYDNSGAGITYNPTFEYLTVGNSTVSQGEILSPTGSFDFVRAGYGNVNVPGINFGNGGDEDTGFYRSASNTFEAVTGGNSVFTFGTSSVFSNVQLNMNSFNIVSLADPSNPQDAATKAYVDANAGASITGTNSGVPQQLVFTDGSDLFFDNSGSGISYDASNEYLYIGGSVQIDGTNSIIYSSFYEGNQIIENNVGPGIDNEYYVFSNQNTTSTRYIAAPQTASSQTNNVAIASRGSAGSTTNVVIGSDFGSSSVQVNGQFLVAPVGGIPNWNFGSSGLFTDLPLDMGTEKITSLGDPTNPQDAATKAYVDANAGGSPVGNNDNVAYKVLFTDESGIFFDNSGTSVAYNPSQGRLSAPTMAPTLLYSGAGSSANPSISFAADTDTGFFNSSSNNSINVSLGGTNSFVFATTGMLTNLSLDFGNVGKITSLVNPTAAQDAATKNYVDTAVAGAGGGLTITNTATNATHYITFTDQTSGSETQGLVDTSNLTYNPSTNILTTGTFVETSDASIKINVEKIENATDKVRQINGYTYEKTTDSTVGVRHAGVIAQEIEKVLPEVVVLNDGTGLKSVAYGNLVALLIESLKEQDARIAELEAKLGG